MDKVKNTSKHPIAALNCRGRLLYVEKPLVMGIMNVTPDSFYSGNSRNTVLEYVEQARAMLNEGADILDIGGQSTRPGAERISEEMEMERVLPVIRAIIDSIPDAVISIDTFYASVAEAAVKSGASMINDISAGEIDPRMIPRAASLNVPYILMHMKGSPEDMLQLAAYDDVVLEVMDFFIRKTDACRKAGIRDIILDPGFGFGKNSWHNFLLLSQLPVFSFMGFPILCGLSRKSTIYKTLGVDAALALNGTTVLNTIALIHGASILRVHDAREAKEAIQLLNAYDSAR
jgi:dihydropteroate synthase